MTVKAQDALQMPKSQRKMNRRCGKQNWRKRRSSSPSTRRTRGPEDLYSSRNDWTKGKSISTPETTTWLRQRARKWFHGCPLPSPRTPRGRPSPQWSRCRHARPRWYRASWPRGFLPRRCKVGLPALRGSGWHETPLLLLPPEHNTQGHSGGLLLLTAGSTVAIGSELVRCLWDQPVYFVRFGETGPPARASGVLCSVTSSKMNLPVPLLLFISAVKLRRYLMLGLNLPTMQVSSWIDLRPVVLSVKMVVRKACLIQQLEWCS